MKNDYKGQTQKIVLVNEWYNLLIKVINCNTDYRNDRLMINYINIKKWMSKMVFIIICINEN